MKIRTFLVLGLFSFTAQAGESGLFHRIRYHCGDSEKQTRLQVLAETVIRESLQSFETINPIIRNKIITRLAEKNLVFRCDERGFLEEMHADSIGRWHEFWAYRVTLNPKYLDGSFGESPPLVSKYIILHELLHYARVDNFTTAEHNRAHSEGIAEVDNVYSCAYLVYQTPQADMNLYKATKTCRVAFGNELN